MRIKFNVKDKLMGMFGIRKSKTDLTFEKYRNHRINRSLQRNQRVLLKLLAINIEKNVWEFDNLYWQDAATVEAKGRRYFYYSRKIIQNSSAYMLMSLLSNNKKLVLKYSPEQFQRLFYKVLMKLWLLNGDNRSKRCYHPGQHGFIQGKKPKLSMDLTVKDYSGQADDFVFNNLYELLTHKKETTFTMSGCEVGVPMGLGYSPLLSVIVLNDSLYR
ncbi:hypothetical protein HOY80DRAFT_1006663 [Tuber brumale]|nr:hypothetical protein HOY80DRAFT_1006663 [Tuber brumale]